MVFGLQISRGAESEVFDVFDVTREFHVALPKAGLCSPSTGKSCGGSLQCTALPVQLGMRATALLLGDKQKLVVSSQAQPPRRGQGRVPSARRDVLASPLLSVFRGTVHINLLHNPLNYVYFSNP